MQIHQPATPGFVLRPSVVLSILWGGICCVWFVWVVLTAKLPPGDQPQLLALMASGEFMLASVVNVALFFFLFFDFRIARQSPPGFKRGHMIGIVLAMTGVAMAQAAFLIARAPIDFA